MNAYKIRAIVAADAMNPVPSVNILKVSQWKKVSLTFIISNVKHFSVKLIKRFYRKVQKSFSLYNRWDKGKVVKEVRSGGILGSKFSGGTDIFV